MHSNTLFYMRSQKLYQESSNGSCFTRFSPLLHDLFVIISYNDIFLFNSWILYSTSFYVLSFFPHSAGYTHIQILTQKNKVFSYTICREIWTTWDSSTSSDIRFVLNVKYILAQVHVLLLQYCYFSFNITLRNSKTYSYLEQNYEWIKCYAFNLRNKYWCLV